MLLRPKQIIVISTVIVLIFLTALVFIGKNLQRKRNVEFTPSPLTQINKSGLREEALKIKEQMTITDKKIGDLIILDNGTAKITYLISNDQFIVEIKKVPFEDGKKEIESWFISKGFTQVELCVLRISFGTSKTIKPNLTGNEILPSGCKS